MFLAISGGRGALLSLVLSMVLSVCIPLHAHEVTAPSTSSFVSRTDTQLILNGSHWRFSGYNLYWLTSVPGGYICGAGITDAQVQSYLDEMQASSSTNVVRAWFYQSFVMNGDWTAFDRLLAAAAARNMKVIATLTDQWGNCELPRGGQRNYHTLAWYTGDYQQADDGYPLAYRDYVATVAARYANDPTIAFWQLVNEAEAGTTAVGPCNESAAATGLRQFADDMTGVLKRADPNHLVDLGTLGSGQCGTVDDDYTQVHAGAVDLCEYHDYHNEKQALPGDQWNGLLVRLRQCGALQKPLFVGEIGILANVQADESAAGPVTAKTLAQRAQFIDAKLNAQYQAGVAGILLWAKGDTSQSYDIGPCDPVEATVRNHRPYMGPSSGIPGLRKCPAP